MTYTQLAIVGVVSAITFDVIFAKTFLVKRRVFWCSYAIIIAFQLLTNWWLTSRHIVVYDREAITGLRIASAPIEDLLFGFALVLSTLSNWIRLGALDKQH